MYICIINNKTKKLKDMLKRITLLSIVVFGMVTAKCQIGIGTTNPDTNTVLHIATPNGEIKGVKLPIATREQLAMIENPTEGLTFYVPDAKGTKYKWIWSHELNRKVYKPTEYHGRIVTWDGHHW